MLLCDTGVLLAAGNVKDQAHHASLELLRTADGPLREARAWLASLLPPCPARDDVLSIATAMAARSLAVVRWQAVWDTRCASEEPSRYGGIVKPEIDYASPGPLTGLDGLAPEVLEGIGDDPVQVCMPVHLLVIQPDAAKDLGLGEDRLGERNLRPAARILGALLALNPAPAGAGRPAGQRVVGTCRHFALLSCAFLRYRGIAARVRCGFATYFQPGQGLDHWVTEYQDGDGRWVRIDSEILGGTVLDHPEDLRSGEFLSGGEAWAALRRGEIDAAQFGVYGTPNWGPAEIRGNAVKDLAALNKVEMLPWDEWGRMTAAYRGETGEDYDELLDEIATACTADDPAAVARLYARDDLRVPAELIG